MSYKDMGMTAAANSQQTPHLTNLTNVPSHQIAARSNETSNYGNTLGMQQSLDLRGNLGNLSHIVDRYSTDDRMLPSSYYGDKTGLAGANMFSKPSATNASSKNRVLSWNIFSLKCIALFLGLPVFSQSNVSMPYGHEMQTAAGTMYNRQMTELQNVEKSSPAQTDKKTKRRKNAKNGEFIGTMGKIHQKLLFLQL